MANEVEIPGELILPEPRDQWERDLVNSLQERDRQWAVALLKISSLLP